MGASQVRLSSADQAVCDEGIDERRQIAGGPVCAHHFAARADAGTLKLEDGLDRNGSIVVDPSDLGDRRDPLAAVGVSRKLDAEVDAACDLLADRAGWEIDAAHEDQRLEPRDGFLNKI